MQMLFCWRTKQLQWRIIQDGTVGGSNSVHSHVDMNTCPAQIWALALFCLGNLYLLDKVLNNIHTYIHTYINTYIQMRYQQMYKSTLKLIIDDLNIWEEENQIDGTQCFIELVICSTCFGHVYAYRQELATMPLVWYVACKSWLLVVGRSGTGLQAMRPEWRMLLEWLRAASLIPDA